MDKERLAQILEKAKNRDKEIEVQKEEELIAKKRAEIDAEIKKDKEETEQEAEPEPKPEPEPEKKPETDEKDTVSTLQILHDDALFRNELLLRLDILNQTLYKLFAYLKGDDEEESKKE